MDKKLTIPPKERKLGKAKYERELKNLEAELVRLQQWIKK